MEFCPHCGKRLPEQSEDFKFCPECGKELPCMEAAANICPNCAAELPEYATRCERCDTNLSLSHENVSIEFQPTDDDTEQVSHSPPLLQSYEQKSPQPKSFRLPLLRLEFILPLIICLPFFIIGVITLNDVSNAVQSFITVSGVVVENDTTLFSDGTSAYVPVVEFYTNRGDKIRFTDDSVGTIPPAYQPGDKVEVIYNPENPLEARISSFVHLYLFPVIFIVVGLLPILIILFIQLKIRRVFNRVITMMKGG